VVIGGVQRLVQIAQKMNQKLERQNAFRRRRGRVFEFGREFLDLVHHTVLRGALARKLSYVQARKSEAGIVEIRMVDLDVHKMPDGGFAVRIAVFVRPSCPAGEIAGRQRVRIARQQSVQGGSGRRRQVPIGDQRGDLMAEIAPGDRLRADQRREGRGHSEEGLSQPVK